MGYLHDTKGTAPSLLIVKGEHNFIIRRCSRDDTHPLINPRTT